MTAPPAEEHPRFDVVDVYELGIPIDVDMARCMLDDLARTPVHVRICQATLDAVRDASKPPEGWTPPPALAPPTFGGVAIVLDEAVPPGEAHVAVHRTTPRGEIAFEDYVNQRLTESFAEHVAELPASTWFREQRDDGTSCGWWCGLCGQSGSAPEEHDEAACEAKMAAWAPIGLLNVDPRAFDQPRPPATPQRGADE